MDDVVDRIATETPGLVPDVTSPVPGTPPDQIPDEGPVRTELLPMTAQVRTDGHLAVGGVDLLELAERFGTPLFVYDEDHLRARCREAVAAWGDGVAYATKAFLCLAMARLAHEEGMWLDVSTGGELHVALAAGVPPARLVFHGNNKSEEELARALERRVSAASSSTPSTRSSGWPAWRPGRRAAATHRRRPC